MTIQHTHPLYMNEDCRKKEIQRMYNELFPTLKRPNAQTNSRKEKPRADRKAV